MSNHILVAGGSQFGKSSWTQCALSTLARYNTPRDVQFAICDPKGEFVHWYDTPHLLMPVAVDSDACQALIVKLVERMDERRELFAETTSRNYLQYTHRTGKRLPIIVVLVDEFVDISIDVGRSFMPLLMKLATKAASYGIRLILTTASPKADVLDSTVRAQCQIRIAFHCNEGGHSEAVFGPGRKDAYTMPAIPGRLVAALPGKSELIVAQSYYIDDGQLDLVRADLLRQFRARTAVIDNETDDEPDPALVLNDTERQWVAWALEYGQGRFNISRVSAKFDITNNATNPVRALGKRLADEGWLKPGEKPTESRLITDELRAEFKLL